MENKEINNSNTIGTLDHKNFGPMLDSFVQFAAKELDLKKVPTIELSKTQDSPSFGSYNPKKNHIITVTKNRHPMDIYRTVAHELQHHKQNEENRIGKDIANEGSTGSDIENEANATAGKILRNYAKANPDHFKTGHVVENYIQEGIHDQGKLKAVFFAGGTGSGKDWVMKRTAFGHGLTEINSDVPLEHLMKKNKLDLKMPDSEEQKRNFLRLKAKSLSKTQQHSAIKNGKGVIINSTASDPGSIHQIKKHLERSGYDTMMVYVNTSDNISKLRNKERGERGGRTVPEHIRKTNWEDAQVAKNELRNIFGSNKFIHVNNDVDYRTASDDRRKEIDKEHLNIFKKIRHFAHSEPSSSEAKSFIDSEMKRKNITKYSSPKSTKIGRRAKEIKSEKAKVKIPPYVPNPVELEQAKRLGTQHIGGGVFGQSKEKPEYQSKSGVLVPAKLKVMKEEIKERILNKKFKKKFVAKEENAPILGYEFGSNTIGPSFSTKLSTGIGSGYSIPMSESIRLWAEKPETLQRFTEK